MLKNSEARVKYLQNQINKIHGGLDRPPCWIDPHTDKIQYLFRVVIMNELIRLENIAPESRQEEYFKIPSVQLITSRDLDVEEFRHLAAPILEYTKHKENDCRHYVLYDYIGPQGNKTYITLEAMETYFYNLD